MGTQRTIRTHLYPFLTKGDGFAARIRFVVCGLLFEGYFGLTGDESKWTLSKQENGDGRKERRWMGF